MLGTIHHDPRRFDRALLGRPPTRAKVGLSELLDDLGVGLQKVIEESGVSAVGLYLGTNAFLESGGIGPGLRFASALESRSFYSALTVDVMAKFAAGIKVTGGAHMLLPKIDFARANFLLILGSNPIVSHGFSNPVTRIREVKERGEVWVADPRRTETAKLATRHLQIRAPTDVVLLAYLVRELLRDGADEGYLSDCTSGVETLREAVEPYTLEATAESVGLPAQDLLELVNGIRRAGTIAVYAATGTRMGPHPSVTEWLILVLSIVTGSLDRPGGNMVLSRGLLFAPEWASAEAPGPPSRPELTTWGGQCPCSAMADEIESGNLRALICFGGNPITAFPDQGRVRAALRSLDVLAVHDILPTACTELATHILPSTGQFEDGCLVRSVTPDGRHFMQYSQAILSPLGDRRPAWWYMNEIGNRLGLAIFGSDISESVVHAPIGAQEDVVETLLSAPNSMIVGDEVTFGSLVDDLPGRRWNLAPTELVNQFLQMDDIPELILVPRRQARHVNSFLIDCAGASGKLDEADLVMHPIDARKASISDGSQVVVSSSIGELSMRVHVSDDISRGAVSIPHGYPGANVNELISAIDDVDPISGMPLQCGTRVAIRPA